MKARPVGPVPRLGDGEGEATSPLRPVSRDACRFSSSLATSSAAAPAVSPLTAERVLGRERVHDVLSVMYTCGMYDFAGVGQRNRRTREEWRECSRRARDRGPLRATDGLVP